MERKDEGPELKVLLLKRNRERFNKVTCRNASLTEKPQLWSDLTRIKLKCKVGLSI